MFINRMISSTLNIKEIRRTIKKAVYIPSTQIKAIFEGNVTYPMNEMIDDLKKQLCRAQQKRSPSSSNVSSNDEKDIIYRQRLRTLPSESFSCEEEHLHQRKRRSLSRKGVGTDVMKKALSQISKSPFTREIEKAKLPKRFYQPTFAMYNGRTDPVEHVSQFKLKMAVYSQDEALMCRVFPSSLGPMPMRWFDGLKTNSINSFKKLTQSFCSRFITCNRVP